MSTGKCFIIYSGGVAHHVTQNSKEQNYPTK